MIFNVTGGGGTSLNFRVVGGMVQPESAKENTIWVKTDTQITSWSFSPTESASPAGGMVWIKTTETSAARFNALQKNEIAVLLGQAKQYSGGEWAAVSAYIYANGEWVQFSHSIVYLYKKGDKCTDLTGGWYTKAWKFNNSQGEWGAEPTVTYGNTNVRISHQKGSGDSPCGGGWFTNDTINLDGYKTIVFHATNGNFAAGSYSDAWVGVFNTANSYSSAIAESQISDRTGWTYTNKTFSVDVSKINSKNYRIGAYFRSSGNSMSVTFDEIYLQA